jgi:hypothetical protein
MYEIMGYDEDELEGDEFEIMGDDDDDELEGDELEGDFYGNELMGRRRRRRKRRGRRRVKRRGYSRERGLLLGFDSQAIAIGATVDFPANPQVPFRAKRTLIGATVIATLLVEDIKVGKNSQFVTAGGFPAVGFAGNTFDQSIKFDTAYPGIDITVTITNNDPAVNTTAVGMFGVAAER